MFGDLRAVEITAQPVDCGLHTRHALAERGKVSVEHRSTLTDTRHEVAAHNADGHLRRAEATYQPRLLDLFDRVIAIATSAHPPTAAATGRSGRKNAARCATGRTAPRTPRSSITAPRRTANTLNQHEGQAGRAKDDELALNYSFHGSRSGGRREKRVGRIDNPTASPRLPRASPERQPMKRFVAIVPTRQRSRWETSLVDSRGEP